MASSDFFDEYMTKIRGRVSTLDPDRCWIWRGAVHGKEGAVQYGVMRVKRPGESSSKPTEVHRIVYMCKMRVAYLPKTDGRGEKLEVSHLCGRSLCCNPDHLNYEPHRINNNRMFCFNRGSCYAHTGHPDCVSFSILLSLLFLLLLLLLLLL